MFSGQSIVNTGFGAAIVASTSAIGSWDDNPKIAAAATSFGWVVGTCVEHLGNAFLIDKTSLTIVSLSATVFSGYALGRMLDNNYSIGQHLGNVVAGKVVNAAFRAIIGSPAPADRR